MQLANGIRSQFYIIKMQFTFKTRPRQLVLFQRVLFMWCIIGIYYFIIDRKHDSNPIELITKRNNQIKNPKFRKTHNVSCHFQTERDVLPSVANPQFHPKPNSIFFIQTTCRGKLTSLQACAIESAARTNPKLQVYALFTSSITNESLNSEYLGEVLKYTNVNVRRIHINDYVKDTPVATVLANHLRQISHPKEDLEKILSVVTLHKWGGTYLSNDMIVFRSMMKLPKHWVAKQDYGVSSRILTIGKDDFGEFLTNEIMKKISEIYPSLDNKTPDVITQLLKQLCPEVFKSNECRGMKIFERDLFYPIHFTPGVLELEDADTDVGDLKIPYTYHHLYDTNEYNSYQVDEEWPFEMLTKKFCPYIFKLKEVFNHVN